MPHVCTRFRCRVRERIAALIPSPAAPPMLRALAILVLGGGGAGPVGTWLPLAAARNLDAAEAGAAPACCAPDTPAPSATPGPAAPPAPLPTGGNGLAAIIAAQQQVRTLRATAEYRSLRLDQPPADAAEAAAGAGSMHLEVFLAKPDRYCLVFTKPGDAEWRHSLLSDGVTRWEVEQQFADQAPDVKRRPASAVDPTLARLLACLRLDMPVLTHAFAIQVQAPQAIAADPAAPAVPPGTAVRLLLVPRTSDPPAADAPGDGVRSIRIDLDQAYQPLQVGIDDAQDNRYVVRVRSLAVNPPLPDRIFTGPGPP